MAWNVRTLVIELLGMHSKGSFQWKLYEARWHEGRELIPPLPTAHPALEPGVISLVLCSLGQLPSGSMQNINGRRRPPRVRVPWKASRRTQKKRRISLQNLMPSIIIGIAVDSNQALKHVKSFPSAKSNRSPANTDLDFVLEG
jgi:hypothetical protein